MKLSHTFLAVAGSLALAVPARAAVTVDFNEMFDREIGSPETILRPTVTGWDSFSATGGAVGTVILIDFFAFAPGAFSDTYSLLEPGTKDDISDQITFSTVAGSKALVITFKSDPADFTKTVYGSTREGMDPAPIPLPKDLANKALTVSAQSDLDVPEPATWILMLLGFCVAGLALRRCVDAAYLQHLV